jgi:hypothetical protein
LRFEEHHKILRRCSPIFSTFHKSGVKGSPLVSIAAQTSNAPSSYSLLNLSHLPSNTLPLVIPLQKDMHVAI